MGHVFRRLAHFFGNLTHFTRLFIVVYSRIPLTPLRGRRTLTKGGSTLFMMYLSNHPTCSAVNSMMRLPNKAYVAKS